MVFLLRPGTISRTPVGGIHDSNRELAVAILGLYNNDRIVSAGNCPLC